MLGTAISAIAAGVNIYDITKFRAKGLRLPQLPFQQGGCQDVNVGRQNGNNINVNGDGNTVIVNNGENNCCQNRRNAQMARMMQYMTRMMSQMMRYFSQMFSQFAGGCGCGGFHSAIGCADGGWRF